MKITYDHKADAINITFKEGKSKKTVEISPEVFVDFHSKGSPLYLEIIGAKEKIGKKSAEEFLMKNLVVVSK